MAAPLFVRPSNQVVLTDIVLTAMMCLSLVVLTGYAGHVRSVSSRSSGSAPPPADGSTSSACRTYRPPRS